MKKSILTLLLFSLFCKIAFTQFIPTALKENNTVIGNLCNERLPNGSLYFKEELSLKADSFFSIYGTSMGMGSNDLMVVSQINTDEFGFSHYTFEQYYQGLEVEKGGYKLHAKNGILFLAYGKIIEGIDLSIIPSITESEALSIALSNVDAEHFAWENDSLATYWDWDEDSTENLSFYPQGELKICYNYGNEFVKENYFLAYIFEIYTDELVKWRVCINAETGEIIYSKEEMYGCTPANGTCSTHFNGTQTIQTRQKGNHFTLQDCDRNIKTVWGTNGSVVQDNDNTWGTLNKTITSTSAHWATEKTWDYYHYNFGREGTDDNYRRVKVFADLPRDFNNWDYSWGRDLINIGERGGFELVMIDAIGHEFTHGVIMETAELDILSTEETASLSESFCDIFGTMAENYAKGSLDWSFEGDGEEVRNLYDPSLHNQPQIYHDPNWCSNCSSGHNNSGVQNKWFQLLVEGGNFNSQIVYGIGVSDASKITYRSLTQYLDEDSKYNEARQFSIQAAIDLFGNCSNQVAQVRNAWRAVGVETANTENCVTIWGENMICDDELHEDHTFTAISQVGTTFSWSSLPVGCSRVIYGTGSNTMKITFIPNNLNSVSFSVTATLNGQNFVDNHTINIEDCSFDEPGDPCPGCPKRLAYNDGLTMVYPNPASEFLNIVLKENMTFPAKGQIIDIQGRVIFTDMYDTNKISVNLQNISNGYYFFVIGYLRIPFIVQKN